MNDMRNFGCTGGSCPKQENCQRFLDKDNRDHKFFTPPFNMYNHGHRVECRCGYQEYPQKKN